MNDNFEYTPRDIRFDAPDLSDLDERSRELFERSRMILENMTKTLHRLQEAIDRSEKFLRKGNHGPPSNGGSKKEEKSTVEAR